MRNNILYSIVLIFMCAAHSYAQMPKPLETLHSGNTSVPVYDLTGLNVLMHPAATNDTTYIINFWATWCIPCVQELPNFELIADSFANRPVKVVLVSQDFYKTATQSLIPFIESHKLKSTVILFHQSGSAWIDAVDKSWDGALPVTLICKGSQRQFINSSITYPILKSNLLKFLKS